MNNHTKIWKVTEEWINSQSRDTSFSNMPLSIKNSLDKASCIKIMQEKLFGYDSDNIYDIKYLPEHLKSDTEIAILAIELCSNNIFEISQSLMTSVDFHKLLVRNTNIYYEYIFSHSPSSIRGNKEFVNQIISRYPSIYTHLTDELFTDRGILLKVLKKRVFPDRLPLIFSNDKKIVFKLIDVISSNQKKRDFGNGTSYLLTFISKELLINRDVLIKLYSSIKYNIMEIPDYFKTDEEVVINAVKSYPSHYNTLNDNLKINPKVAVEAFKGEHELFLKHISQYKFEYSTILEFVKSLVKPTNPKWAGEFPNNSGEFEKIADKLVENNMFIDGIALHLTSIWPDDIYFYKYFNVLSPELKKDKRIVSLLLKTSVSEEMMCFHKHEEICKDFVTAKYVYENYIISYLSDDRDLTLKTIKYAPSLYPKIPDIFKSDEEIILEASRLKSIERRDEFLKTLPNDYLNNKSLIIKLLKTHLSSDFDDCIFKFTSDSLRNDNDFVKEAIKIQPQSILHASERLKNDIEYQRLAFNSFQKVRRVLRKSHEDYYRKNGIPLWKSPFCNNKTDDLLDFEFLKKNCKKLLNNKEFLIKYNIKKTPWKPNSPWKLWEEIKNHWRNEFNQTEIYNDENEHIIIFKNNDTFIIVGFLHYSDCFWMSAHGLIDFIDFIKKLGNKYYNPFKVYLLCNCYLSKIKKASDILTLPNDVEYYYVDYNWFQETIDFKLDNLKIAIKHSSSLEQINTPWYKKMGIEVITDDRFEDWEKWSNKGYHREWYDWNDDERFEYWYYQMVSANIEWYIDEGLLGFYLVWKWNRE